MTVKLATRSLEFAGEIQRLLEATLPGAHSVISLRQAERYVIRPGGSESKQRRIPLHIGGKVLAELTFNFNQELDRTGEYLKTSKTDFFIYSILDRSPLVRLEYNADMRKAPTSHWQIHAERGALSALLAYAHSLDRVDDPHDLSRLHFPTGGERFRPPLEDFLEFMIRECGFDAVEGWETAIEQGRKRWRLVQFRTAVRDLQQDAAEVLKKNGWRVSAPTIGKSPRWDKPYEKW